MKKINYWIIMLVLAGSFIAACKGPDEEPEPAPEPEPTLKDSLWLTSFEYVASPYKPDSSHYAGSFSYSFDVTTGAVVTAGSAGVPATAITGTKMYQMKTTSSAAYYGGGFGFGPGAGNNFDTLDINDKFSFWYNYNGNTETSLKVQLVDPVDGDVFIKNIPAGGTGWQRASLRLSTFTWDAEDPANKTGPHDKKMNVTAMAAFKFIYFNANAGTALEVYIDDIKIIDYEGGSKILQP
jgi:hypothetical protein